MCVCVCEFYCTVNYNTPKKKICITSQMGKRSLESEDVFHCLFFQLQHALSGLGTVASPLSHMQTWYHGSPPPSQDYFLFLPCSFKTPFLLLGLGGTI